MDESEVDESKVDDVHSSSTQGLSNSEELKPQYKLKPKHKLDSEPELNSEPELDSNHASKPRYVAGQVGIPGQGPHMLIVLQVKADRIVKAQFSTYGCPAAVACGQFVTEQVEGKAWQSVEQAGICEETILSGVGQMPLGREHCPGLAVRALRHALEQLASGEPLL